MDYPVTTPFGQVAGYPLNNGFHNGIDYGYPMGTPVVVNGVQIGISNNTGATTGPHLHIGKFVNGVVQDPGVGNGLSFNSAVVYDTGYDATNGNYVRITGDGALWNYLHLKSTSVTKGQVLKGGTDDMKVESTGQAQLIAATTLHKQVDDATAKAWVGRDIVDLLTEIEGSADHDRQDKELNAYPGYVAYTHDVNAALGIPNDTPDKGLAQTAVQQLRDKADGGSSNNAAAQAKIDQIKKIVEQP